MQRRPLRTGPPPDAPTPPVDVLLRHRWPRLLAVPLLALAVGLLMLLLDASVLHLLRNFTFDHLQRLHPRPATDAPVTVVDIDETSLQRLGQWPWPRTRVAELVRVVNAGGPAAIGFDVIFGEPDRTSPQAVSQTWALSPAVRRAVDALPDHDDVLAAALREAPVVLGHALRHEPGGTLTPSTRDPNRYAVLGASPLPYLHGFEGVSAALPRLAEAAAGQGALTFMADGDGVVRRVPLVLKLGEVPVPSLSAEMLRVGQGARNTVLRMAPAEGTGLAEVRIGAVAVPVTPRGEAWVHYRRPSPDRTVPAWQVLAGEVPPQAWAGRLVLVGSSAQGLLDLRFSPLGGAMPGVEAHAQLLEQALTGTALMRPGWARAAELLLLVAGGTVLGLLAAATSVLVSASALLVLSAALGAASVYAFVEHGLLLDPVTPAAGMLLVYGLASGMHHLSKEREQRWIRAAFSRYVSPNLVSWIVDHPQQLELGGRRQVCSFVFTDLADFTSLIEGTDPARPVALLNEYLDGMIAIAFRHAGTLDRIVGDAVAIMFSAPVPQPDHAQRALRCALEMQRYAEAHRRRLAGEGIAFGRTRIGVHTGEVIVGNFGGRTIFDYRALGDPVNTASRLESANKELGTRVCVSDATLQGCPDVAARPVGRLLLKGKQVPLMVHQPLHDGLDDAGTDADPAAYGAAYALLQAGDAAAARAAFEALRQHHPDDPLVALHHRRLLHAGPADAGALDLIVVGGR